MATVAPPLPQLAEAFVNSDRDRTRLTELLNHIPAMVCDLAGVISFWSDGCRDLFGWTAEQAVGRVGAELLHTVFPKPLIEIEEMLLYQREWTGNLVQRASSGAEINTRCHMTLREDPGGLGSRFSVLEVITDITTEMRALTVRCDGEMELPHLVNDTSDGVVVAHADGRIAAVNPAALHMFGYEHNYDLIGRDLGVLMPSAEAARHRRYVGAYHAGAPPRVIGVPGRRLLAMRRDGSRFPVDLSVSSFDEGSHYIAAIIRDATAREDTEHELRDLKENMQHAVAPTTAIQTAVSSGNPADGHAHVLSKDLISPTPSWLNARSITAYASYWKR